MKVVGAIVGQVGHIIIPRNTSGLAVLVDIMPMQIIAFCTLADCFVAKPADMKSLMDPDFYKALYSVNVRNNKPGTACAGFCFTVIQ